MAVKCTGAEFNAFMSDPVIWKKDHWMDDVFCEVNGQQNDLEYSFEGDDVLPPDAEVKVEGGAYYTGSGVDATFYDFDATLRKWLKARLVTTLVIEVPNSMVDHVTKLLTDTDSQIKVTRG